MILFVSALFFAFRVTFGVASHVDDAVGVYYGGEDHEQQGS